MNRAKARSTIFACKRASDMADDDLRALYLFHSDNRTDSQRALTDAEVVSVAKEMQSKSPKPKAAKGRAPRADLRLVHVLWKLLGDAGKLSQPGRAGLNAFIRKRFEKSWSSVPLDVDQMRDYKQISMVIDALKAWCRREGVELRE